MEIIGYVKNSDIYYESSSAIDNVLILREIVKKCGFKSNLISNPNIKKKPSDDHLKDAFKR